MLRIILIRHGQTEWNQGSEYGEHFRGRIDIALNPTGIGQARSLAERLASLRIAAVYASPLQRALGTASAIASAHNLVPEAFSGLLDIDYGQWSGKSHREVASQWPDLYRRWVHTPHLVQLPDGESLADVRQRAWAGLQALLKRHDGQIILLVGHQVVNKILICSLLGLDNSAFWRIRQDTGCINRFDYDGEVFTVLTLNEVGHLPARPRDLDELPA